MKHSIFGANYDFKIILSTTYWSYPQPLVDNSIFYSFLVIKKVKKAKNKKSQNVTFYNLRFYILYLFLDNNSLSTISCELSTAACG
ncbi:hypothetical protein WR164_00860 [Philodulcilactobacillus myokoensis]|uniref:Uncharacterized protein n=1 Tax=Philodulcilactobacillus myokoensis TaxID=2929573 RepID=A0A9W6AYY7_9LACO|nr:hypothetical protein WR164_00860 [Philodulcilactobacillus myokoensis]